MLSRRSLLGGGAALAVSFTLERPSFPAATAQTAPPRLPGSLRTTPMLDAWLRIDANGISVFTGKAELGQGIRTALLQVADEELAVDLKTIALITADLGQACAAAVNWDDDPDAARATVTWLACTSADALRARLAFPHANRAEHLEHCMLTLSACKCASPHGCQPFRPRSSSPPWVNSPTPRSRC